MPKTGVWSGWYRYDDDPEKNPWHVALTMDGTRFSGEGEDDFGDFDIQGQTDGDGVRWTKRYRLMADDPDATVHYRGRRDAEGRLSGDWKLSDGTRGTWGAHAALDEHAFDGLVPSIPQR